MSLPSAMIIDDSEADRYLLARMIRKAGIAEEVFEASDGGEALAFLRDKEAKVAQYGDRFPPLLLFLDINMPGLGGFAFLEAFASLRQELSYESIVLMMYSSSNRPEDRSRAEAYEFVKGYIVKMPDSSEDLKASVRAAGVDFD